MFVLHSTFNTFILELKTNTEPNITTEYQSITFFILCDIAFVDYLRFYKLWSQYFTFLSFTCQMKVTNGV